MTLKEKLEQASALLQNMDIKATLANVRALDFALLAIDEAYHVLQDEEPKEKGGDKNGTV